MALRGTSCHRVLAPPWPSVASAVAVPMYAAGSSYAIDFVCCYLLVAAAVCGAIVVCAAAVPCVCCRRAVCAAAVPSLMPALLCRRRAACALSLGPILAAVRAYYVALSLLGWRCQVIL